MSPSVQGFGVADGSGGVVIPQTPFILASASKSFTALAIMQLVEDGKVDLDAPVVTYLPSFSVADESASATIMVRHLLNHTSALPESTAYEPMPSNDISDTALNERMRAVSDAEVNHGVGEVFEYTDAKYEAFGLIVEKVSGQPYETHIHERIFAPMGMSHSFTNQSDARQSGMASGQRSWFGFPGHSTGPTHGPPCRAATSSQAPRTSRPSRPTQRRNLRRRVHPFPAGIAAMHQPAVQEGDRDIFYGMDWESRTLAGVWAGTASVPAAGSCARPRDEPEQALTGRST